MRSLFIIGLPRSLSTLTFEQTSRALKLRAPEWTSAGELLNPDRWFGNDQATGSPSKFAPPENRFQTEQLLSFLSDTVKPEGHCYKDVVQPFATSQWLLKHAHSIAIIRITRSLADIAYAMQRAEWNYPVNAVAQPRGGMDDLLNGLLRAQNALQQVPAVELSYDELIADQSVLTAALHKLYPGENIGDCRYITPEFRQRAQQILKRRWTQQWQTLNARLAELA